MLDLTGVSKSGRVVYGAVMCDSTVKQSHLVRYLLIGVNYLLYSTRAKDSSDALFTPKIPIFTTLSQCTISMRISENLSLI